MAGEYVHEITIVYAHTLCIQFPASIVGLPRESRISRALSVRMKAMAGKDPTRLRNVGKTASEIGAQIGDLKSWSWWFLWACREVGSRKQP